MDADTLRKQRFIINFLYTCIGVALYYIFFRYVIYKIWPFAIAAIVALSLNRPAVRLSKKLHIPKKGISFVLVVLVLGILGTGVTLLVIRLIYWIANMLTDLPQWYSINVSPSIQWVMNRYEEFAVNLNPQISTYINDIESSILTKLMEAVTYISSRSLNLTKNLVTGLPGMLLSILFTVVATFIMSIDSVGIGYFVMSQFKESTQDSIRQALGYIRRGIRQIILSYGLIMLITFIELNIGFRVIGMDISIGTAALVAIFDILPIVGSGTILIPWAIILIIKGQIFMGIKMLLMYVVIAAIRNAFLEPKVVGDSIGIHPVLMLMSLFLGATILGPLGIIIMPFTMIVIKNLNDNGFIHMFKSEYYDPAAAKDRANSHADERTDIPPIDQEHQEDTQTYD